MKHLLLIIIAAVVLVETAFANPIQHAVLNGDLVGVQSELDKGVDVNLKGLGEFTPLHYAAAFGHQEIAALLIRSGADVNAKDEKGWALLHFMAVAGNKEIAELLINSGAVVHANTDTGWTPLHLADNKEIAELLIAKGANVNSKGESGGTPLDIANGWGHEPAIALLRKHGGKTGEELKAEGK